MLYIVKSLITIACSCFLCSSTDSPKRCFHSSGNFGMYTWDVMGMGNYAHGNQPIQHMLYLYDWCSQPWKTQARVREVMGKFSAAATQLAGREVHAVLEELSDKPAEAKRSLEDLKAFKEVHFI